jgi:hypothetical protein
MTGGAAARFGSGLTCTSENAFAAGDGRRWLRRRLPPRSFRAHDASVDTLIPRASANTRCDSPLACHADTNSSHSDAGRRSRFFVMPPIYGTP